MDNKSSLCLIGTMDRLWFQQLILFPETLEPKQTCSESTTTITSTCTSSSLSLSSAEYQGTPAPDDSKTEDEQQVKKRSRRGRLGRSHSSSTQKRQRIHQGKLRKSMSCCRSLKDLELEEVKGFMDLGFKFTKEHSSPRMIRVVPGLLRLGIFGSKPVKSEVDHIAAADELLIKDDDIEQEEEKIIIRPYLSDAWMIKRPDSPLLKLRLRVPKGSAAADMKKHLKFWARTVASVLQQES